MLNLKRQRDRGFRRHASRPKRRVFDVRGRTARIVDLGLDRNRRIKQHPDAVWREQLKRIYLTGEADRHGLIRLDDQRLDRRQRCRGHCHEAAARYLLVHAAGRHGEFPSDGKREIRDQGVRHIGSQCDLKNRHDTSGGRRTNQLLSLIDHLTDEDA